MTDITIPLHLLSPPTLRKIKELVVADYSLACRDGGESLAQPQYNEVEREFRTLIEAIDRELDWYERVNIPG